MALKAFLAGMALLALSIGLLLPLPTGPRVDPTSQVPGVEIGRP